MKVRKAIIPAAGLGTRFLPATKATPKEMLPIVDKPTIQYIVEEALASGIEDIIIVTGRGKSAIEDHFDKSFELETTLASKGKHDLFNEVDAISNMANIYYVRQKEAKGLGHAVWCARKFVGNEPFAVLLGDDVVVAQQPCLQQMVEQFERFNSSIIGIREVPEADVSKYGIVTPSNEITPNKLFDVSSLVEKPQPEAAPSRLAIMGRYILTPEIFDILEHQTPGAGGEIQITDAINQLAQRQKVFGYVFDGVRYDVGDKLGFIKATMEFALGREDLSDAVADYILELYDVMVAKRKTIAS